MSICLTIRHKEVADFARDLPVTEITPRLDTIQVKGDQISFRGRSMVKPFKSTIKRKQSKNSSILLN